MNSSNLAVTPQQLCGQDESLLIELPELQCRVHAAVRTPLMCLYASAQAAGFKLAIASSFRSFERQLFIWNAKASGRRPVLNSVGEPLDITQLSETELVFAILRWSALPGASRHHWGTDFDVYDAAAVAANYPLQLTVAETEGAGPFTRFHQWLDEALAREGDNGFYRPYGVDRGGVAPEPWHLSYGSVARQFSAKMSEAVLRDCISASDIFLKQVVLDNLAEIYQRFIRLDE